MHRLAHFRGGTSHLDGRVVADETGCDMDGSGIDDPCRSEQAKQHPGLIVAYVQRLAMMIDRNCNNGQFPAHIA